MEQEVFDGSKNKGIEGGGKAAGIVAIVVAIVYSLPIFLSPYYLTMQHLRYGWNDFTAIAALIMFIIYVFSFYGKNGSVLLGLSAIFTGGYSLFKVFRILQVMLTLPTEMHFSFLRSLVGAILLGAVLIILAISYFKKIVVIARILPVIAVVLAVIWPTTPSGYMLLGIPAYSPLFVLISILYLIPFLLFGLFCPISYESAATNIQDANIQEQKITMDELNRQLQHLKNEFDNGRITKEQYDYWKWYWTDKL